MQKYVLFIGIDISKKWIDVCLSLDGNKKQMPHCQFDNTPEGFKVMLQFIRKWLKEQSKIIKRSQWLFCMEHTGVYTFLLTKFLQRKKLIFVLVNPLHLKYSLGIRRGKNDKADAADITRFAFLYQQELKPSSLPSDNLLIIKNLLSLRGRLVKSQKGLTTASNEIKKFVSPQLSHDVVKYSKQNLKQIQKTISQLEQRIIQIIRKDDELHRLYQLVTSVKGVGIIIGASLLVYTAGFTAFKSSRQFATYIGLAPFARQSGTSLITPGRVSYLAHKKLKGDISCGAAVATQHDQQLKNYYQRKIEEGKNKFAVQNAIRNKFIHRIFAVVKRGTPYVELDLHIS